MTTRKISFYNKARRESKKRVTVMKRSATRDALWTVSIATTLRPISMLPHDAVSAL